jgi:hypothetical protein
LIEKTDKHTSRKDKVALPNDAPGPSSTLLKSHGKGSVKKKVVQILSHAPREIYPRMRKSFVDRQYSPSNDMGLSEWEFILEELTCMGYIVKEEPDSDGNE